MQTFEPSRREKRRYIGMSADEESILDSLKGLAVENFAEGNFDPMTAAI